MTRRWLAIFTVLGLLAAAWASGRIWFEDPLPDRGARRVAFPDPMDPALSLRDAFDTLPAEGRGRAQLRLLEGNAAAWVERWRLLADAQKRVDVSYFILKKDIFGIAFLGHLIHKAQQGVHIRLTLDAMGTRMSRSPRDNDYLDALVKTENITARIYRPLRLRVLDTVLTLSSAGIIASDHDKIMLADDRIGIFGGRNISAEYFAPHEDDPLAFHDLDVALASKAVAAALQASFAVQFESPDARGILLDRIDLKDASHDLLLAYHAMDAWLHARSLDSAVAADIETRGLSWLDELERLPHLRGAMLETSPRYFSAEVQLLDSQARRIEADDPITRSLLRFVKSARDSLFIQSPYLVLPPAAVEVLSEAASRGVKITVFTNGPNATDNPLSQALFQEQWPELLAQVPTLRLFVQGDARNLHGKLAVIDSELALVGTYNLDPLSMAMHSELIAAIWSPEVSAELLSVRAAAIGKGPPQVYEYTLRRDADGNPLRDAAGRPIVGSGMEQHETIPEAVRWYRTLVRLLLAMPVDWPVFR